DCDQPATLRVKRIVHDLFFFQDLGTSAANEALDGVNRLLRLEDSDPVSLVSNQRFGPRSREVCHRGRQATPLGVGNHQWNPRVDCRDQGIGRAQINANYPAHSSFVADEREVTFRFHFFNRGFDSSICAAVLSDPAWSNWDQWLVSTS